MSRDMLSDAPRQVPEVIAVATPTLGMVSMYWHVQMRALWDTHKPMRRALVPAIVKGKEVGEARNDIVRYVLSLDRDHGMHATHIFFVDDDVIIEPDGLIRLLSHDRPIVSGLYFAKTPTPQPLMFDEQYKGVSPRWTSGKLEDCHVHGMGYTLIQTDVFRAMDPPWFQTTKGEWVTDQEYKCETEDVYFCERALAKGYQPAVDTGLLGLHYDHREDRGYPVDEWARFLEHGKVERRSEVAA